MKFLTRWLPLAILFCLTSISCSRVMYKTAYNQIDLVIMNRLDNYFDLRDKQETFLKSRVTAHHTWHRQKQLPLYAADLAGFKKRVARGLNESDAEWLFGRLGIYWDAVLRRIYPDAVIFLKSVSPEQLPGLRRAMKESNEELEDSLRQPRAERLNERLEKTVDFYEDWSGSLSKSQLQKLKTLSFALPENSSHYLRYRRGRQKKFLEMMQPGNRSQLKEKLSPWFLSFEESRPAYYRQASRLWRKGAVRLMVEVDRSFSDVQRGQFIKSIEELILDINDLTLK